MYTPSKKNNKLIQSVCNKYKLIIAKKKEVQAYCFKLKGT